MDSCRHVFMWIPTSSPVCVSFKSVHFINVMYADSCILVCALVGQYMIVWNLNLTQAYEQLPLTRLCNAEKNRQISGKTFAIHQEKLELCILHLLTTLASRTAASFLDSLISDHCMMRQPDTMSSSLNYESCCSSTSDVDTVALAGMRRLGLRLCQAAGPTVQRLHCGKVEWSNTRPSQVQERRHRMGDLDLLSLFFNTRCTLPKLSRLPSAPQ
jgi:hypothetical protein